MSSNNPTSDTVLGIDLGTTYCAMAVVDRFGKPTVVVNSEGQTTTPSVIHFYDRDACVVGEEAVKMVVADPTNVVRFIKRSMGEPDFNLEFFGRSYTPQELSAIVLKKLKEDAEEAFGAPMKDAVITVPAYFNSAQRGATAEAGAIAGLNVLSIINEPTTAAISYGIERLGGNRRVLVFDLGGGTFDVTLMEIKGISFRTIASDGNAELGGKDWDDRLLNHIAEQFAERFSQDPRDDPRPYQDLYERCLAAKISLSSKPKAVFPVNFKGHRMIAQVTRDEFNEMCADLVDQCADTCQLVLEKARMSWQHLDEVLLVGGSTRMPMIREMLNRLSGQKVDPTKVNPDECVALGAALAGVLRHRPNHPALLLHRQNLAKRARANRTGARSNSIQPARPSLTPSSDPSRPGAFGASTPSFGHAADARNPMGASPSMPGIKGSSNSSPGYLGLPPVQITDATSHPLGIIVLNRHHQERVYTLIPEATPVPCEKSGRFAYAFDNMTAIRVEVTEGVGTTRDAVKVIGEVVLEDLPPRPRGTPIQVVYRYNINQMLEIDIVDVTTGSIRRARMNLRGGLGEQGVAQAQKTVASFAVH
jgi:molecular chaperone DnaK